MDTVMMRSYVGEPDLQRIADLVNACDLVDQLEEGTSVAELRQMLSEPTMDTARDVRLWEGTDGTLLSFSMLWIPPTGEACDGFLWFVVHPGARDGELEADVIGWAAERMREVGRERGVSAYVRSGADRRDVERLALLERHGFTRVRSFLRMSRSLHEPIPESQLPPGFTLRHFAGEHEAAAWVEMFNQSFIDHWNHHDMTLERRLHWMTNPNYKPEHDLMIVAPDGTFAAFCFGQIYPEENERNGRLEGWIDRLGTRRGFRRLGLGRAVLLEGLRRFKAEGLDAAVLGVDAENPTGATRLYEGVGFRETRAFYTYTKEVYSGASVERGGQDEH